METITIEKARPTRNEVYKREFGKRFLEALEARGLSRSEAARIVGVNPGRMVEYASGARLVPLDTLDEIVAKLDLNPRILFPQWFARARGRRLSRVVSN